jgi:MPBQ/MSBQ methyltransferase
LRFIQHKAEAFWFYRFLSPLYDRWVNPLFWTERMRDEALSLARLDDRTLSTLDVGAGTGFATEGIVAHVDPANVTMLDQSPHQLGRARKKASLAAVTKLLGDAEDLPFPTDEFDRYVSCGSIEYWPDPQRAMAEAYRVVKPGGIALVVGPLPPRRAFARRLADAWMLFPREAEYHEWMQRAGFADVRAEYVKPDWHEAEQYGIAIAGRKPAPGESPAATPAPSERRDEPMTLRRRAAFAGRFLAGSAAGAAFVPIGVAASLRARRRR